jgi:GH25 family lysozyme M1 (1,4-beta-N-acetylmuramidase)
MTVSSRPELRRRGLAGALALFVAVAATPLGAPTARAATTDLASNCNVNLRSAPSKSAAVTTILPTGSLVTVTGVVPGDPWSATCGSAVAGATWYAIATINGQSVSALFGVEVAYAGTGLFRPADSPVFVEGVDVSRWQGAIDFTSVASAGKRFVLAKATEGIGFLDPMYLNNRFGAASAGLAVGAYHYARPDLNPSNPQAEADWFVDNLGLVPGMLAPALDLEEAGTLGTEGLQAWVGAWLGQVYARTGVRPMVYASPAFWKKYLGDTTAFADQGYAVLWVAHWLVAGPTTPANNWSNRGWTFWQYDNCGHIPGISGCVDLDRYNGTDLTPMTFGADFALSPSPATATVEQGNQTTFAIALTRSFFTTPIDLSVLGLPAGATASFSVSPVTDMSAVLTVTTAAVGAATPAGTYPLTITGSAGGVTRTTVAELNITDAQPPVISAPVFRLTYPVKLDASIPVRMLWSAADPSGIGSYGLQRQVDGGAWEDVMLPEALSASVTEPLTIGSTYGYATRAMDSVGNLSEWVPGGRAAVLLTEEASSSVVYTGTWKSSANQNASGGRLKYATRKGASATYKFTGAAVALVAYRGPNRGSARVYVDGVLKKTINLYASTYSAKQVVYAFNWGATGAHSIKIVGLGTAGHPRVDVDAFLNLTLP